LFTVPFVPTPELVAERMLTLAGTKPGELVYDLGAGDGRIVILAARSFGATAVGVELQESRLKIIAERIRKEKLEQSASVIHGDFLDVDLSKADVVTLYLLPSVNTLIRPKLEHELSFGARVVSHDFPIQGWFPMQLERVEAEHRTHAIYLYKVPRSKMIGSYFEASLNPNQTGHRHLRRKSPFSTRTRSVSQMA
jgi:tRNA G37 N-methylase Trm5